MGAKKKVLQNAKAQLDQEADGDKTVEIKIDAANVEKATEPEAKNLEKSERKAEFAPKHIDTPVSDDSVGVKPIADKKPQGPPKPDGSKPVEQQPPVNKVQDLGADPSPVVEEPTSNESQVADAVEGDLPDAVPSV